MRQMVRMARRSRLRLCMHIVSVKMYLPSFCCAGRVAYATRPAQQHKQQHKQQHTHTHTPYSICWCVVVSFCCAGRVARATRPAQKHNTSTHQHMLYGVCCCLCCCAGRFARATRPAQHHKQPHTHHIAYDGVLLFCFAGRVVPANMPGQARPVGPDSGLRQRQGQAVASRR